MILNLHDLSKRAQQTVLFTIEERLPGFIASPCSTEVQYRVEAIDDFYLLHLKIQATVTINCQRCLTDFQFPYKNQSIIAIATSEARAETLQETYECVVAENGEVILDDLVIDELHLYVIQSHPLDKECNSEITSKFETSIGSVDIL